MNILSSIKLKGKILIFSLVFSEINAQSDSLSGNNLPVVLVSPDSSISEIKQVNSPTKISYRLSADGTYNSGNVNRALVQLASGVEWNLNQIFKFSSNQSYIYGQQNKLLNEREIAADFRTSFLYEKTLYYLVFASYDKSNLRKINERIIGGAGVGLKILQRKKAYLSVTNVLLLEKTDFIINDDISDKNLWRNSTRILGEYTLADGKFFLSHIIFIQPALTEKNFRWNGNMTFRYQITQRTGIRSSLENSYESVVVSGRKNNDFRWTFGVVFEFKK